MLSSFSASQFSDDVFIRSDQMLSLSFNLISLFAYLSTTTCSTELIFDEDSSTISFSFMSFPFLNPPSAVIIILESESKTLSFNDVELNPEKITV